MSAKHEFRCSICDAPNAGYALRGVEYCSACMPKDVILAFTENMTPKGAMAWKRAMRAAGNKALNGESNE